ncbi:MAG TPA: AAA family ATPase, partial [Abditibacteriaceae bacterium]
MVISLVNQKGGVGKTTTAVNLAAAIAAQRKKKPVLLIDFDGQANASALLGIKEPRLSIFNSVVEPENVPLESILVKPNVPNLLLAPGHLAMAGVSEALKDTLGKEMILAELLEPIREKYSAVIIDNGPSLGTATAMSLCASDIALVAVLCESLSLQGLPQIIQTISAAQKRLNPKLQRRFVFSRVDRKKSTEKIMAQVRGAFGSECLNACIPASEHLKNGILRGGAVTSYAPATPA